MDKLTPEQRQKNMQPIKSKGSKIEITLAKTLWAKGHRYRKNDKSVYEKPNLTLKRYNLAIFVDNEFWLGKNWDFHKNDHKTNKVFWHKKIEKILKEISW